jgi:hypothetical protein
MAATGCWSQTTTTTAILIIMMTITNNNTTNITNTTAQQGKKRTPEEKKQLMRDRWEDRVTDALFRQLKRKVRAANALFGTPEWVSIEQTPTWSMLHHGEDVTRHAALAEECLDDARANAKRKGRALPPL